jgi:hypothetical protein
MSAIALVNRCALDKDVAHCDLLKRFNTCLLGKPVNNLRVLREKEVLHPSNDCVLLMGKSITYSYLLGYLVSKYANSTDYMLSCRKLLPNIYYEQKKCTGISAVLCYVPVYTCKTEERDFVVVFLHVT